jgi:hypothetical protein
VVITVSGDDESWVDKKLASISIEFGGTKSQYSAKTIFDKMSSSSRQKYQYGNQLYRKNSKKRKRKIENQYGNYCHT